MPKYLIIVERPQILNKIEDMIYVILFIDFTISKHKDSLKFEKNKFKHY
jgi:hypothetical protein